MTRRQPDDPGALPRPAVPPLSLDPAWRDILRRAWSVRFILLAGVLDALAFVLVAVAGATAFSLAMQILAGLASGAALIARIVVQSDLPPGT